MVWIWSLLILADIIFTFIGYGNGIEEGNKLIRYFFTLYPFHYDIILMIYSIIMFSLIAGIIFGYKRISTNMQSLYKNLMVIGITSRAIIVGAWIYVLVSIGVI